MKNTLDGIYTWLDIVEDENNELKDTTIETLQNETQKRILKYEDII